MVQVTACHLYGTKSLSEPASVSVFSIPPLGTCLEKFESNAINSRQRIWKCLLSSCCHLRRLQCVIHKDVLLNAMNFVARGHFMNALLFITSTYTGMSTHVWILHALLYPPNNEVVGGYIGFTPSVCPSVRLSRLPCPRCNIYSSGWILSAFYLFWLGIRYELVNSMGNHGTAGDILRTQAF